MSTQSHYFYHTPSIYKGRTFLSIIKL